MNYIPAISLLVFVIIVVAVLKLRFHPILKIGILVISVIILREVAYAYIVSYNNNLVANNEKPVISSLSAFSVSTAVIGVITFFGFMWFGDKKGGKVALTKEGMRLAIVASIVTVFLVLASSVVFFTGAQQMSEIAELFIQQLNITVGTVLVFYFGASAYVQAQAKEDKEESKEGDEQES